MIAVGLQLYNAPAAVVRRGLQVWIRHSDTTGGVTVTNTFTNDLTDRVIELYNVSHNSDPGVGQFIAWRKITLEEATPMGGGGENWLRFNNVALAINVNDELWWSGQGVIIPPGWKVICTTAFDAGVANVVRTAVYGVAIPIGSIQPT